MRRPPTSSKNQIWIIPAWALALGGLVVLLFVILCYILFWPRHPEAPRGGPAHRSQGNAQLAPPSKLRQTSPSHRPEETQAEETQAGPQQNPAASSSNPVLPPAPSQATVPADTQIAVRTSALINSNADPVGSRFSGTVTTPVVVNGQTVVPQGSTVVLHLASKKKTGFFHRSLEIKVALAGISVNGRIYPVQAGVLGIKAGENGNGAAGENADGSPQKGKKALVILPNTDMTFTLAAPFTVVSANTLGSASVNSGKGK